MEQLEEKIKKAEQTFKLAAEMSLYYYKAPLIVCYSGGKDSDVLLDIAKKTLKPTDFEVLNSHTTADAPETVYHIRKVFKNLNDEGIKTEIRLPRDKDGNLTSIWKLIEQRGIPPTRLMRYCCDVLKEQSTPNRMIAHGVREDESVGRRGRDIFGVRGHRKADAEYRTVEHTFAMFKLDQLGVENSYECKMIESCKKNKDTIVMPIYRFTFEDIWEYINTFNLKVNPLYSRGYKRVGCVGCPLAGKAAQKKEFSDFPIYRKNYVKAFDRMIETRKQKGKPCTGAFKDGETVMRWWVGEDYNQITIDDILGE